MTELHIGSWKDTQVTLPMQVLRKHFFAFGGSGSGKTVLSKVILEEAALKGLPSIVIDLQGDLASLAIDASPEDGGGSDGDTKHPFSDDVAVEVFTPASSKGIPLSLNPLNFTVKDEEDAVGIINETATSIAKLIGYSMNNDRGKAAAAVLYLVLKESHDTKRPIASFDELADLLERGSSSDLESDIRQYMHTDKEMTELVRKLRFLTVGQLDLMFNYGTPLDIETLLGRKREDQKTQVSVIYLNSLSSQEQKEFYLTEIVSKLYQWLLANPSDALQCLFAIDEIAPFIPAGSEKPLPKPMLLLLFKQARKYGCGMLIATQNPGDIDYKAFAQFGTWAMGRLTTTQDRKKIEKPIKTMTSTDILSKLPTLSPGTFVLFSPDVHNKPIWVTVRWLRTQHTTLTDDDIPSIMDGSSLRKLSMRKTSRHTEPEDDEQKEKSKPSPTEGNDTQKDDTVLNRGPHKETKRAKRQEEDVEQVDDHEDKDDDEGYLHFPLRVSGGDIERLMKRHMRKNLFIIPKERIGSYDLKLHPVYKAIVAHKRTMRHDPKIHTVFIDARDGKLHTYENNGSGVFEGFTSLYPLNDQDIRVLRVLQERATSITTAELALKIKINQKQATASLNRLKRRKLVSHITEGNHKIWFSIIPSEAITTRFIQVTSGTVPLMRKTPEKRPLKPKVDIDDAERLLREWFPGTQITDHELVYLPTYSVTYLGKSGDRKIELNGYTTKVINTQG